MAQITKEITLDVVRENICGTVSAKQNDVDSRFLKIRITADRSSLDVAENAAVLINSVRPDGEKKAFLGEVNSDGSVTVPLTQWMLSLVGAVKCDISIIDEGKRLTTMPFYVNVDEVIYDGEGISEDEEADFLCSLISEAKEIQNTEAERVNAETARAISETERKNSETERVISENERAEAERQREESELERKEAEKTRATFIPSITEDGYLSWTNDKGLENPQPVQIKPVKTVDYWTEQDKKELIDEVMSSLNTAEEAGGF
jgi:hypothetical protein